MDPITILAALAPLGVELGKSLIGRFIAPADLKPATVDDWLKMRGFDLEMFKAVSDAGGSNPTYLWVEAVKQLLRPGVGVCVLLTWCYAHVASYPDTASIDNFASAIGFYLFGDRTLFYASKLPAVKTK